MKLPRSEETDERYLALPQGKQSKTRLKNSNDV